MTPQDRAREAAWDVFVAANTKGCHTKTAFNKAIDAFLTTVLEGADEKIAEIRKTHDAYETWRKERHPASLGLYRYQLEIHNQRADLLTLVTALSAKLKEVEIERGKWKHENSLSMFALKNEQRRASDYRREARALQKPGADEAFSALDLADALIERAYGTDVPLEWKRAYRKVAKARALPSPQVKG